MSGGLKLCLTFQVNEKCRAGKIGAVKCGKKILSYFVYRKPMFGDV